MNARRSLAGALGSLTHSPCRGERRAHVFDHTTSGACAVQLPGALVMFSAERHTLHGTFRANVRNPEQGVDGFRER